ncbi:MAG: sulfatase [Myxococcota bacterium]
MLKRGALGGLGWGWAVGLVHLAVGVALIVKLNAPPMTWFTAKSILLETSVAVALGALLAPLTLAPNGRLAHLGGMALGWLALERWVAVDPTRLEMWIAPTVVGVVLFGLGTALGRYAPIALAAVAALLPPALVATPVVNYTLGGYADTPNADRGAPPEGAPDVLFIVMDTTRAKSVSALGYDRDTTPNLDALAAEGALYLQATSSATWSLPAHASLFTGHYPSSHEAHDETRMLDDRLPTLAATMSKRGWQALAFSANPYISDTYGLVRGFEWTDKAWQTGDGGRQFSFIYRLIDRLGFSAEDKGGGQVVENLRGWMASRKPDDPPAFVFVNFLEAHFPFNQLPEPYLYAYTQEPASALAGASQTAFGVQFGRQLTDAEQQQIRQPILDMYDGGVKYTDHLVGEVIDLWRDAGRLDHTVVIVVGDHGEMVGEHGAFGHVSSLYQPDLHVPLVVRYPAKVPAGTRVEEPVTTTGIYATILDLLGQDYLELQLQAGSLLPDSPLRGPVVTERFEEKMLAERFAPGTANGKGPLLQPRGRYRAYREGDLKYVEYSGEGGPWLFDLRADPNEDADLASSQPEKLGEMKATLDALGFKPLDAPVGTTVQKKARSAEECQMLVKLGYIAEDGVEDCMAGG